MNSIEEIESYLDNRMNESDRLAFEARLEQTAELQEMLQEERDARSVVEAAGRIELQNTLANFETELTDRNDEKVIPLWVKRVLPIAAMAVLFFMAYQFLQPKSMTTAQVYDTYFETYPAAILRGGSDQAALQDALVLYGESDFEAASVLLSSITQPDAFGAFHFYTGLTYMQINTPEYDTALTNFNEVLNTDNDYREQATWYKALCLLKLDKKDEALNLLRAIVAEQTFQHKNAKEILNIELTN